MVQAPSFFTLAAHEVRRLRSRSVAVMVSRSSAASNRKFDRMGIVVLRSTTPWVAVSSLSNSNLLTLISIAVPWIAPVASAAIVFTFAVASVTAERSSVVATLNAATTAFPYIK